MVCQNPKSCAGSPNFEPLPPLKKGQSSINDFKAPISLEGVSTVLTLINSLEPSGPDGEPELHQRFVDLPLARGKVGH